MTDIRDLTVDEWKSQPIPAAPAELELAERLAWRLGYRQAFNDLLAIEVNGGHVAINDTIVHIVEVQ